LGGKLIHIAIDTVLSLITARREKKTGKQKKNKEKTGKKEIRESKKFP